ncbi:TlpA family protein disulfide reductase [Paraburkholderia bryophila]|uniref:Thiol-disulfide isomerase/thioredoxin n=1 Tax=Paraburkholderia bryophila TaxID=420952 RepID=A0A329CG25_9BURK|nr:TlpA disulfide reductase family protein [Paraburkholderia bryophila]RAS33298.1 thiol-disulfide isomerase/thioredoxin [Paraburkholderia bryophila]
MNIGPCSFPVAPLILLANIGIALWVARKASHGGPAAETTILYSVVAGLLASRLAFVGQYLPAYRGDVLKMLDFRDLGFDPVPGAVAGAVVLLVMVAKRRDVRRAATLAAFAGCASWGLATAFADTEAPAASLPAVNVLDMNGNPQPLAYNDGKPLVLNLWASWCGPCRAEMPVLAEAQRDFTQVDIAFINQGESEAAVNGFVTEHGLVLHNLARDPNLSVARAVGARAFPTTLFYDHTGKLLAMHLGPFSRATFEQALETLYPKTVRGALH